ncbi:hypothetical protein LCGC14_2514960 [marine sediment metagenome]|uniref:Uncharacterized protein n=1 Tax=marine sediment metagenome TaxID=412755 RepID=A0A0F9D9M8_9ZZZZ
MGLDAIEVNAIKGGMIAISQKSEGTTQSVLFPANVADAVIELVREAEEELASGGGDEIPG